MSVKIGNLTLGTGKTKICVPIIGKSREEILEKAEEIKKTDADIVEWRADFYENMDKTDRVLLICESLVKILNDKPLIFTVRTKGEGGQASIDIQHYKMLLNSVISQNLVGAVDVEFFFSDTVLEEMSKKAKDTDVKIIGSNHDFSLTPPKDEIVRRLTDMKKKGADISKIAVMPNKAEDVITLIDATIEAKNKYSDMTLITMSMGKLGTISRLAGYISGSAMTFGSADKDSASAPGQIQADQLEKILGILE